MHSLVQPAPSGAIAPIRGDRRDPPADGEGALFARILRARSEFATADHTPAATGAQADATRPADTDPMLPARAGVARGSTETDTAAPDPGQRVWLPGQIAVEADSANHASMRIGSSDNSAVPQAKHASGRTGQAEPGGVADGLARSASLAPQAPAGAEASGHHIPAVTIADDMHVARGKTSAAPTEGVINLPVSAGTTTITAAATAKHPTGHDAATSRPDAMLAKPITVPHGADSPRSVRDRAAAPETPKPGPVRQATTLSDGRVVSLPPPSANGPVRQARPPVRPDTAPLKPETATLPPLARQAGPDGVDMALLVRSDGAASPRADRTSHSTVSRETASPATTALSPPPTAAHAAQASPGNPPSRNPASPPAGGPKPLRGPDLASAPAAFHADRRPLPRQPGENTTGGIHARQSVDGHAATPAIAQAPQPAARERAPLAATPPATAPPRKPPPTQDASRPPVPEDRQAAKPAPPQAHRHAPPFAELSAAQATPRPTATTATAAAGSDHKDAGTTPAPGVIASDARSVQWHPTPGPGAMKAVLPPGSPPPAAEDAPSVGQQLRIGMPEAFATALADTPRSPEAVSVAPPSIQPQPSPDHGRAAALQIAAAAGNLPDGGVEITLSPEELGRVRLTMSGAEGAMTITIQAERGETLDLLRRNIELLAQELRDMGFGTLSFSFGQGQQGAADNSDLRGQQEGSLPGESARPNEPGHDLAHEAGLDLRL